MRNYQSQMMLVFESHTQHKFLKHFLGSLKNQSDIRSTEDLLIYLKQALMTGDPSCRPELIKIPQEKSLDRIDWSSFGLFARQQQDELVVSNCQEKEECLANSAHWYHFEQVKTDRSTKADPFFPFGSYNNEGQREAVRSFLCAPDGTTTLMQLPTGSGKSVLFTLPLLLNPSNRQLNIIVVPTVSLALDQERRIRNDKKLGAILEHALAWHSDLSEFDKEEIKTRIRNGRQKILFVNPENLSGSLVRVVFEAAKNKTLKNLFVDEAHIIGEWGDQFRPDFQDLGMLKRALLDIQPSLKTVLLSATVNQHTAALLEDLFSDDNSQKFGFCSYNYMREEPAYFSIKVPKAEKSKVLLGVFRRTPRPAIFYANTPSEVEWLGRELSKAGHKSFGVFSGKTSGQIRKDIIEKWDRNELDAIIATSAFGVGIDKPNVRCVVHFAVPETLDRYYQEVGRSGRDGKSSTAISIFCEEDLKQTTSRIQDQIIIGSEKAWHRWEYLLGQANQNLVNINEKNLLLFDLSVVPPWIDGQSKANQMWNHYLLRMMDQKKVIKRYFFPPDEFTSHVVPDLEEDEFWEQFRSKIPVEIIDDMYGSRSTFEHIFSETNLSLKKSLLKSNSLLIDVLVGQSSMEDALNETYSIPDKRVYIAKACRRCTHHASPIKSLSKPMLLRSNLSIKRNQLYTSIYERSASYLFYVDTQSDLKFFVPQIIRKGGISQLFFYGDQNSQVSKFLIEEVKKMHLGRPIFIDYLRGNLSSNLEHTFRDELALMILDQNITRLPSNLVGLSPCLLLLHEATLLPDVDRKLIDQFPKPFMVNAYLNEISQ